MAAITSIAVANGVFDSARTTLSADDTITFDTTKKQLLVLHNPTGGSLTATLDGTGGTTAYAPGIGNVDVSSGLGITLAAGASKSVLLSSVSAYCQGVVHLTGGAGIVVQLFNL